MWATDGRVGAEPVLKLQLTNLKMRLQANSQAGFCVSQQLNAGSITMPELVQRLKDGDESIPRKIISVGANLLNTAPYWCAEHTKVRSLQQWRRAFEGDTFCYFQTLSMAEFHWPQMRALLEVPLYV
jgi:hypothetical protein